MKRSEIQTAKQIAVWLCWLSMLAACGMPAPLPNRADQIREIYHQELQTVLVAAHRGGHTQVPENSLAAIDEAIEAGAHIVELDVRQTKDGVFVLMHDKTLERTTTGTGAVQDFTYDELRTLRLTYQGEATTHTIPTLEEALLRAKGNILVDIDFKTDGMQARFDAYGLIANVGMEHQVLFFCYDYTEMPVLHAYNPNIKIMPRAYNLEQLNAIIESGLTDIVHIDASYYDDTLMGEVLNGKNIRIWANVLGDVDQAAINDENGGYQSFFDRMKHVNVVQTDYPALLLAHLNQRSYNEKELELSQ